MRRGQRNKEPTKEYVAGFRNGQHHELRKLAKEVERLSELRGYEDIAATLMELIRERQAELPERVR